ncbi:MAG: hypothetical protein WDZ35_10515 [Crocinitomicaceae bacterium]
MKDLSKRLYKKIEKIEAGKVSIDELEGLVEDARNLYERLVIVKYKAYEKFGAAEKPAAPKEEKGKKSKDAAEEKNESFDFSGITEKKSTVEQPAFDFTAVEDDSQEGAVLEEDHFKESAAIKSEVPDVEEEEIEETQIEEADDNTEQEEEEEEQEEETNTKAHDQEDDDSLHSKLKVEEDQLSLRKKLQSTPIKNLKDEISIAKKFEYITFMFEGKNENYEAAIEVLNNCDDSDEAKNKLNEYSIKYNWDLENKSIIKFVELVERRYL